MSKVVPDSWVEIEALGRRVGGMIAERASYDMRTI
jgi:hypothetical protein